MRKLGIFLIIFVSLNFFSFNQKVDAAAVPISENELDEYKIEWFIDHAKDYYDGHRATSIAENFTKIKAFYIGLQILVKIKIVL